MANGEHELHEIILFSSPDEPDEPDGWRNDYLVNLVNLVIIFQTFFVSFVLSVGKNSHLLLNKLLPPVSKTYEHL